jgi:hypothetical protein
MTEIWRTFWSGPTSPRPSSLQWQPAVGHANRCSRWLPHFGSLAICGALSACHTSSPKPTAPPNEDIIRESWSAFDTAVIRGDWGGARTHLTAESRVLLDDMIATAAEPRPSNLLVSDWAYEMSFASVDAGLVPASLVSVVVSGDTANAQIAGAGDAGVAFRKEGSAWTIDLVGTLVTN